MIGDYPYENDFIASFHKKEEEAFKAIFEELYKDLVYFATKLTNDVAVAEEIVSESFLKLFQRAPFFPSIANIRAFLRITTQNACYNHLSKEKTLNKTKKEFTYLASMKELPINFVNVETELIERIAKEIEKLPNFRRKIFILRYLKQVEPKKIAERLGIHYQVVLNETSLALSQLRKLNKHSTNFTIPFLVLLLL